MARTRKKSKGSYKSIDDDYRPNDGASPGRGNNLRRTSRNKRRVPNMTTTDDYQLRHSIEVDGTMSVVDMNADGNCLFRSLSDQLFGDYGNRHDEVRADVCDFIQDNADDFKVFLVLEDDDEGEDASDFESYVFNMRQDGEWGGNLELVAAARCYRRKITVYSALLAAFTIDNGDETTVGPDLLLSFHDNDHYNSVRLTSSPPRPISMDIAKQSNEKNRKRVVERGSGSSTQTDSHSSGGSLASGRSTEKKTEIAPPKKKNSPCPCGSGLRYKRCCFLAKKKERAKKKDPSSDNGNYTPDGEDSIMKGDFRVLQI